LAILISIKPVYCERIYAGSKTVELRRRCSQSVCDGLPIFIYETSPVSSVTGICTIDRVVRLPLVELRTIALNQGDVTPHEFDKYFHGVDLGFALFLGGVRPLRERVNLPTLRDVHKIRPPQSYSRISASLAQRFVESESFKLPSRHEYTDTGRRLAATSGNLRKAAA